MQNAKLWSTVQRQREAFFKAQEELEEEREESERLIDELSAENNALRDLLLVSDRFSQPVLQSEIRQALKLAEEATAQ